MKSVIILSQKKYSTYKYNKDVNPSNDDGIDPVRVLLAISNLVRFFKFPRELGSEPERMFFCNSNFESVSSFPIAVGIGPDSSLKLNILHKCF